MSSSADPIFGVDLKRLLRRMQEPGSGVPCAELRVKRKKDKKEKSQLEVFAGKQMVDWLVNSSGEATLKDRVAAVRLAQHYLASKEISSVQAWIDGQQESQFGGGPKFADSPDAHYFFQTEQLPEHIYTILSRSPYQTVGHLMKSLADPSTGVATRDRKSHFKKLRDCFVAQELTAWVMNQLQTHTRDEAITFCCYLEKAGWIRSADGKTKAFADKEVLFQFGKSLAELAAYVPHSGTSVGSGMAATVGMGVGIGVGIGVGVGVGVAQLSSSPAGASTSSLLDIGHRPSDLARTASSSALRSFGRDRGNSHVAVGGTEHGEDATTSPLVRTQTDSFLATTRRPTDQHAAPDSAFVDVDSQSSSSAIDGEPARQASRDLSDSVLNGDDSSVSSVSGFTSGKDDSDAATPEPAPASDGSGGNPLLDVLRVEKHFVGELKAFVERVAASQPADVAAAVVGNMPDQLRFHVELIRSLESCQWTERYDAESAALARKHRNGINPLDVSVKMLKLEAGGAIPEEDERYRRAQNPAEHHSALHVAADKCDLNALLSLIEEHPQLVVASDSKLWTPLHSACASGHIGSVDALLRAGAKSTACTNDNALPLHLFVRHSYAPNRLWYSVLKRLREGVDINHQTSTGETPLHYASLNEDTEDNIRWLVRHGADLDRPNLRGNTPLHNAIIQGRSRTVRFLLCCGASLLPCGAVSINQLVKPNSPVATILANWASVFFWWVSVCRVVEQAVWRTKQLLRRHLSNMSRALAALPDDPPAWLAHGLQLPARHVQQLVAALRTATEHDSRNEFVLESMHDSIRRLNDVGDLVAQYDVLAAPHRVLFEIGLSLVKEQRKKFTCPARHDGPELCLLMTPFRLQLVQSSPPVPTVLPKPRTVEQLAPDLPVVACLFTSRFLVLTITDTGEKLLLVSLERDRFCLNKYEKDPARPTLTVTVLRLARRSDNQARFRLVADDHEQIDKWIEHATTCSTKQPLSHPAAVQF